MFQIYRKVVYMRYNHFLYFLLHTNLLHIEISRRKRLFFWGWKNGEWDWNTDEEVCIIEEPKKTLYKFTLYNLNQKSELL